MDALALTPSYSVFLITADVPEVYMHQFWDSVYKHDTFYRFKIDKKKRFKLTLEIFRDIFKICPRVQGQNFDALPTNEEIVSFLRELGYTGKSIHSMISLSGKTTGLDKLRLSRAQILWGMYHQKNVDYVELLWEDFIYQIDNRAYKNQEKMYYPRFTKVIIHYFLTQDKTISWRNKIGMHTSKDDYLINTLRFISAKEATQIYGAILPKLLTSPEMKETKDYKTYIGFSTGATPPKIVRKFKKASPSKKDLNLSLVPVDEEPKSAKKKVPSKKTTRKQTSRVVIRDTKVESSSKRKEKVYVARGKGIELLSEVALIEDTQYEEVRQKSLRDFHKTHLSGSGTVTKTAPSATKIKPSVIDEGTGTKPGVPNVTEEESTKSEAESWGNDEDDSNNDHDSRSEASDQEKDSRDDEEEVKDEFVKTLSNDTDDEDETTIKDKAEGDEDEEMDYTTSQLYDDVDIRLNKPVQANDETVQKEDIPTTKTKIVSPMDIPVHHVVPSGQTPTLLTVPVSVITEYSLVYTTIIPQSLPSFTPLPQLSTPTLPPTTEATNPQSTLPDFVFVFQFNNRVSALEKDVSELKKEDPHKTQVTALVDEHLDARLEATREEFMS
ncbi:hypothetical protein Tco_1308381 [Tanacetum coccineum]